MFELLGWMDVGRPVLVSECVCLGCWDGCMISDCVCVCVCVCLGCWDGCMISDCVCVCVCVCVFGLLGWMYDI